MEEDEDKDTNKVSGVLVGARVCLLCVCVFPCLRAACRSLMYVVACLALCVRVSLHESATLATPGEFFDPLRLTGLVVDCMNVAQVTRVFSRDSGGTQMFQRWQQRSRSCCRWWQQQPQWQQHWQQQQQQQEQPAERSASEKQQLNARGFENIEVFGGGGKVSTAVSGMYSNLG